MKAMELALDVCEGLSGKSLLRSISEAVLHKLGHIIPSSKKAFVRCSFASCVAFCFLCFVCLLLADLGCFLCFAGFAVPLNNAKPKV